MSHSNQNRKEIPCYDTDQHLDTVIERVRKKIYKNLKSVNIKGVLKGSEVGQQMAESKEGKKAKVYTIKKPDELQRFLGMPDFVILVDRTVWDFLQLEQQEAHIDEALARCGWGDKGPFLIDPDVVIFSQVIERRGFYTADLHEAGEKLGQLSLVFEKGFSGQEERVQ